MIKILDSTLREGVQSVSPTNNKRGVTFSEKQATEIVKKLIDFGIDYIEIGSPVNSDWTKNLIERSIELSQDTPTQIAVHCRCHLTDVRQALQAGAKVIHLYLNLTTNYRFDPNKRITDVMCFLEDHQQKSGQSLEVRYSFEDAFKTSYSDISKTLRLIKQDITRVGLPDTTGKASPEQVEKLLFRLDRDFPDLETEFHFHNDLGLAPANTLAAIQHGANVIDTTLLGIGERNGIVSLSNTIALLLAEKSTLEPTIKKYRLSKLIALDKMVAKYLGIKVPLTSVISSAGYFTNTAGVHVNGHANKKGQYANIYPEIIGSDYNVCWASSVVGGSNIVFRAKQLDIKITKEDAKLIANQIREIAKRRGGISSQFVDKYIKQHVQS